MYNEGEHKLERIDGEYYCSICQWSWQYKPRGTCPGIPRYGQLPENLMTYTDLRRLKLKPLDRSKPVGCYYIAQSPFRRYLYDKNEALPRRVPTERQRLAIIKMRAGLVARYTCVRCGWYDSSHGRNKYDRINFRTRLCPPCHELKISNEREARIAAWAHDYLNGQDFVVLDSETTGLNQEKTDEVIELAIISRSGTVLFSSLIQTEDSARIDLATHIHGISREELNTAPTFQEVWPRITAILRRYRRVLVYNSAFDYDLLRTTARRYGYEVPDASWECLMEQYAIFHGEYSRYHRSYTWQKLVVACYTLGVKTDGFHRALEDAMNALGVLKALAALHGKIELLPPYVAPVPTPTDESLGEIESHPF